MRDLLRLLSDPTRVRILAALEGEELAVNEIAEVLEISQSRVSNHLRLLRGADLLQARRDGAWTFYRTRIDEESAHASLWAAVRRGLRDDDELEADARRRRRVLEQRRKRSRTHFGRVNGTLGDLSLATGTLRDEIVAAAAPRDRVAVDAGCGDGGLTEVLADRFDRVVAFDHAPERLAAARERVGAPHVCFALGEVDAVPLADAACDVVFLSLVLHHVPRIPDAIEESWRILRPGGRLVVAELAPHDDEAMRRHGGDLRLGLDPEELLAELARVGFRRARAREARDRVLSGGAKLPIFLADGTKPARRRRTRKSNQSQKTRSRK